MGNLGLPLALVFASENFSVYGVDIDQDRVNNLKNGVLPIKETGLEELLNKPEVKKNFNATDNTQEAILNSVASFIVVNTPSNPDGSYSLKYLKSVSTTVGQALRITNNFHVVVGVSTVSPGDYQNEIIPILEEESGKKCGKDFGFVHNPEFVALGSVIKDNLTPDFRVLGESDEKSGKIIEEIYTSFSKSPIVKMSIINAELTKIALNCYLTIKISFANTIGEMCQSIKGGNADLVLKALGLDKRISPKFLGAGLGYGGPCFPRDDVALMSFGKKVGAQAYLSEASQKVNDRQVEIALNRINKIEDVKSILALGLSYKPDVPYIKESQAFEIVEKLVESNKYDITVYDPQAMDYAKNVLESRVQYANSLQDGLSKNCDLILILTPWKEFKNLEHNSKLLNFWKSETTK